MNSQSIQKFVEQVKEVSEREPQNCSQVDVEVFEDVGQNLAKGMQDYLVNVDLTRSQFDVDLLFEEAGRLGMDFGDLQEYGIEVSSSKCGSASKCINKDSIKSIDDAVNKGKKFFNKFFNQSLDVYERAQCHDDFRTQVTPKVQGVLSTCPLILCTWPCFLFIEVPSCFLCFCIECPYRCLFQGWWDALFYVGFVIISLVLLCIVAFMHLFFLA